MLNLLNERMYFKSQSLGRAGGRGSEGIKHSAQQFLKACKTSACVHQSSSVFPFLARKPYEVLTLFPKGCSNSISENDFQKLRSEIAQAGFRITVSLRLHRLGIISDQCKNGPDFPDGDQSQDLTLLPRYGKGPPHVAADASTHIQGQFSKQ